MPLIVRPSVRISDGWTEWSGLCSPFRMMVGFLTLCPARTCEYIPEVLTGGTILAIKEAKGGVTVLTMRAAEGPSHPPTYDDFLAAGVSGTSLVSGGPGISERSNFRDRPPGHHAGRAIHEVVEEDLIYG